jgi:hypothetical protein
MRALFHIMNNIIPNNPAAKIELDPSTIQDTKIAGANIMNKNERNNKSRWPQKTDRKAVMIILFKITPDIKNPLQYLVGFTSKVS